MEGKGVLFKRFADIDVFDIELATEDPKEVIRACQLMEPTFGGINLEDIKAPECFEIEEELRRTLKIPVFPRRSARDRDHLGGGADQRGGTGGQAAGGRPLVFSGAGASGDFVREALRADGGAAREHPDVRHEGRDLRRAHGGDEQVQGAVRAGDGGADAGRR
jgi:hypothetical protein